MDLAALKSIPLPAHIPMQTKASVSIRIKEYLRYELLSLGVFVTAKIHRHIENPPEDTLSAIILDVHTTATMPWPSYKECLGARSKLEEKFVKEKFESGWNLLEYLNGHHKWRWIVSRAKAVLSHYLFGSLCWLVIQVGILSKSCTSSDLNECVSV
jgi:hypothetical protein